MTVIAVCFLHYSAKIHHFNAITERSSQEEDKMAVF